MNFVIARDFEYGNTANLARGIDSRIETPVGVRLASVCLQEEPTSRWPDRRGDGPSPRTDWECRGGGRLTRLDARLILSNYQAFDR